MQNVIRRVKSVIKHAMGSIKDIRVVIKMRLVRLDLLRDIKSLGCATGQDLLGEMCYAYGLKRAKDADFEQLLNWLSFCSKP